MRQKLISSLEVRMRSEIDPRNPVKFLKELSVENIVDTAISVLYLYTRATRGPKQKVTLMAEVISAIGHTLRNKYKLKRDSALAAKAGAFILYSFEECSIAHIVMTKSSRGHGTFVVEVIDDEVLSELWGGLASDKIEKLPSETPYAPWTSTRHEQTGAYMVKTTCKEVLSALTPETHPIVFNCLNRAMKVGWMVNEEIYNIHLWALRNKTDAFADIWEIQNPEAKQSKLREAKSIGSIAKRFIGKTFYHLYYYDFRGRKYPATAYLHEQGSDLAKGLLLRSDSKPIGEQGFYWLLISLASNWAGDAGREDGYKTDKIPLNDRVYWVLDNLEIFISYADNPKVNQGWMSADKPWQFLAACIELKKVKDYEANGNDIYTYSSHLECYIDGSNNGSQHLSALTRDEVTAPHVNLVPSDLPGDLYKYVADHVWNKIKRDLDNFSKAELKQCNECIDTLLDLKTQITNAPLQSERRKELIDQIMKYKKENQSLIDKSCPVFWSRITDSKFQRKVVKRNVMTLPYGGTAYGLG